MLFLGSDAMDYLEIMDICGYDTMKAEALVNEILIESGLEKYVESVSAAVPDTPGTAGFTG